MRIQPGIGATTGGGLGPALVDRVMEAERAPVEAARGRRAATEEERNGYAALGGMLDALGGIAGTLQAPSGFRRLTVSSSHPEVLVGEAAEGVAVGSYELEVRSLAGRSRFVEGGFPDKDRTPVGFGFLQIAAGDGAPVDVVVEPGTTLERVAAQINELGAGFRAHVIDTGLGDEPFRLSIVSEKSGEAAALAIDPDTTHLGFEQVKAGQDLDLRFEDVAVSRPDNKVQDLFPGLALEAKKAAPGTRVTVEVKPDVDGTLAGVRDFTDKYNEVVRHSASTKAADGTTRSVLRSLQGQVSAPMSGGPFASLAEVGITTNPKTGELAVDDAKLKGALTKSYDGVMRLFTRGEDGGAGIAARLADAVKRLKDPTSGALTTRIKGLERAIQEQDRQIERQTERLDQRREGLERQIAAANTRIAGLEGQGRFLAARFPPGGGEGAT